MSAFFVNKETIDKAVYCSMLGYDLKRDQRDYRGMGELSDFGRELWRMNVEALKSRYSIDEGEIETYEADIAKYSYQPVTGTTAKAVFAVKGLACLLYQCSEGSVPESDLFKRMEAIQAKAEHAIVSNLPEYEAAPWG